MRRPLTLETLWTRVRWLRRSPVGRVVSRALALALIAILGYRLWHLWSSTDLSVRDVQPTIALAAVVASMVAIASYGCVWLVVLRQLGIAVRPAQLALFFKSQLGKYIPGSVWQYASRVGLGRGEEIPANLGLASIVVEVAASLAAALLIGLLALPLWVALGAATLSVVLLTATLLARVRIRRIIRAGPQAGRALIWAGLRIVPAVAPLYALVWLAYGGAFWLTARALFAIPALDLPLYIGVFALAWSVGLVAVFAPGGVGVREAVIVGLLAGHLGEARAIVVAGASRIVLTAIDLALGFVAIARSGWRVPRPQRVEVLDE